MLVGFHGTTAKNAESILKSGNFRHSSGDRHWLGDGVYFFSEELHAYIWNRDHCRSNLGDVSATLLLEHYAIVTASKDDDRIFDLDKVEHHLLFDEAYARACNKLSKVPGARNVECVEGAVLNLMFTRMNFGDSYDVIAATFRVKENRYDNAPFRNRLRGVPQRQICVKNTDAISDVAMDDISSRADDLEAKALILQSKPVWGYSTGHKTRYKT